MVEREAEHVVGLGRRGDEFFDFGEDVAVEVSEEDAVHVQGIVRCE
jgi:hypothetical protein